MRARSKQSKILCALPHNSFFEFPASAEFGYCKCSGDYVGTAKGCIPSLRTNELYIDRGLLPPAPMKPSLHIWENSGCVSRGPYNKASSVLGSIISGPPLSRDIAISLHVLDDIHFQGSGLTLGICQVPHIGWGTVACLFFYAVASQHEESHQK